MSTGAWFAVVLLAATVVLLVAAASSLGDRLGVLVGHLSAPVDPVGDPHE